MSHFPQEVIRFYAYSHYSKVNFIRKRSLVGLPETQINNNSGCQKVTPVRGEFPCKQGDSRVLPPLHTLHDSTLANMPWTVEEREGWKADVALPFLATM